MTEARRLANALIDNADLDAAEGGNPVVCKLERDAAALLRTQHTALERKDALLRQCLEAFETDEFMKKLNASSEIRKELAK